MGKFHFKLFPIGGRFYLSKYPGRPGGVGGAPYGTFSTFRTFSTFSCCPVYQRLNSPPAPCPRAESIRTVWGGRTVQSRALSREEGSWAVVLTPGVPL